MITLTQLRTYIHTITSGIPEIKTIEGLAVEKSMADSVNRIPEEGTPAVFYLPPSSEMCARNADDITERNMIVIFVMKKYSPKHQRSIDVLEEVQPLVERLKHAIVSHQAIPCAPVRVDLTSINTLPETEFFSNWAGWSIALTALD